MIGDKSIVIMLNKLLASKDTDHPKINAMFARLIMHDKETWLPLYQAYLTKTGTAPKSGDKPPDNDPFDRGGR